MEFLDKIKTFDTVVRMKATDKKGTQRGLAKMLQIGTEFREVENVLQKLKDTCKMINETIGIDNNEACKCVGSSEYPETIEGLRSCVKSHMLNYCQDDSNEDMEKKFECQKIEKCEDVKGGNRLSKRQCIKKLCKDEMFAETCHCKSGRKERRKCFRKLEKVE